MDRQAGTPSARGAARRDDSPYPTSTVARITRRLEDWLAAETQIRL